MAACKCRLCLVENWCSMHRILSAKNGNKTELPNHTWTRRIYLNECLAYKKSTQKSYWYKEEEKSKTTTKHTDIIKKIYWREKPKKM